MAKKAPSTMTDFTQRASVTERLDARARFAQDPQEFFQSLYLKTAKQVGDLLLPGSDFAHWAVIASSNFYALVQAGALQKGYDYRTQVKEVSVCKVQERVIRFEKLKQKCLEGLTPEEKAMFLGTVFGDEELTQKATLQVDVVGINAKRAKSTIPPAEPGES